MHIPDGFLDIRTCVTAAALSATGITLAVRQTRRGLGARHAPRMGLAAACVFTVQMLNFPVGAGTSAHLIGAALCATLLGPAQAVVVVTCVLTVQALVFGDGGLLSLGANIFNMAILASLTAWVVYRAVRRIWPTHTGRLAAAALAGFASPVLAAAACSAELAFAGAAPWRIVMPAMVGVHVLVGLAEGLITAMIVAALHARRPEMLDTPAGSRLTTAGLGLVALLGLTVFLAPLASTLPDPVEKLAPTASAPATAPLAGYRTPGVRSAAASTAIAGGIGTLLLFLAAWAAGRLLTNRLRNTLTTEPATEPADV